MIKTIAIIIVMLAINLLMFFSIRRAAIRVDYSMRRLFLQKMSLGDGDITFETENTQPAMDKEADSSPGTGPERNKVVYAPPAAIREVSYKNKNVRDEYRAIRKISCYTPEHALDLTRQRLGNEHKTMKEAAYDYDGLLGELSFDVVYELSSLEPQVQEQLIRDNVKPEYHGIIDVYKAGHEGEFDTSDFYAYLRQMSEMYNEGFIIKTGNKEDDGKVLPDGSRVEYDEGICEGARVIHNNTMYDYSL